MVQGSGFEVYCPLIGMKASYEWGMRNEGSASIYEAMPDGGISLTSHKSQVTSHSRLLIPSP